MVKKMPYVNSDMQSTQLQFLQFLPDERGRGHWDYEENLSPSVRDAVFPNQREAHIDAAETKAESKKPLKIVIQTQDQANQALSAVGRIAMSRKPIKEHLEKRITAFLMQIIDCYDTDRYYTVGKTQNQTESTPKVRFQADRGVVLPPNPVYSMEFASAHHGTLPCVYSYPRVEWEAWKAALSPTAPNKPQATVLNKYSTTYFLNNACTGLGKSVNQADIDLDGNPTEKMLEFDAKEHKYKHKLRAFTIQLLNQAARRDITPVQGFALFLGQLQTRIDAELAAASEDDRKAIFQIWKDEIDAVMREYRANYKWFIARQLGFNAIPVADRDSINLEEIVFPEHFKLIQTKNRYQTHLTAKVHVLSQDILTQAAKKPNHFDAALKLGLMREAQNQDEAIRKIFQRFYNLNGESVEALERDLRAKANPALDLVNRQVSQQKIAQFFTEFKQYVRQFSIEETRFSVNLLKQVRLLKGLSLRRFATQYNAQFPAERTLNYEQYRRIESGCVKLDERKIKQFAQVLGVHESVFLA